MVVRPTRVRLIVTHLSLPSSEQDKSTMAKKQTQDVKHDDTAGQRTASRPKRPRRKILFPTEPTTIPREEINRAIDLVISRRK